MKNFIFISPHFPNTYYRFVEALRVDGFNVLGIGDAPYEEIPEELKRCITEYYLCPNMDNFDNEIKAVQYFKDKYQTIDYIESNNEYWLYKDALLREMFDIKNGPRPDLLNIYQHKSLMKERYLKAGVKVAKWILIDTLDNAIKFVEEVGFPVFIKPDVGVGAEGDYKIKNIEHLKFFFSNCNKNISYICEQYITGNIISYDGICDSNSNVIFSASNFFPPSISEIVEQHKDTFYFTYPEVPHDLEEIGRRVVKAFEVKNRFFHLEFFRLTEDIKNFAAKGEIVALETNMRPAGGYTPDLINYANSVNCYQIWADSVAYDENRQDSTLKKYYAGCASRRDDVDYFYSDEEVLRTFKNEIVNHGRYAKVFSGAMGDRFFMARFNSLADINLFKDYVERRSLSFVNSSNSNHLNLTGEDINMLRENNDNNDKPSICDRHIDGA